MITLACLECHLALRTCGEPVEVDFLVGMKSEWYPDRYPCPRSECKGLMTLTDVMDPQVLPLLEIHDVSPQECFQALKGMGLPKERECGVLETIEAIKDKRVVGMDLYRLANDKRAVLTSILMEDGTRIYLGSSPQGALVYRIAIPYSKATEVLNGS